MSSVSWLIAVLTLITLTSAMNDCTGSASGHLDDFMVSTTINCTTQTISIDITYTKYDTNWFGLVFNDWMDGESVVYTTGKLNDRLEKLYFYNIIDSNMEGVQYNEELNWIELSTNIEGNTIQICYIQHLDKTKFDNNTKTIQMRYALGNSLKLEYHSAGVSEKTLILDLETGASSIETIDLSMQYAHGIIMWITWAVLASIAIMSSAHRWIFENVKIEAFWFKLHKYLNIVVVILCVVGFILAVIFTDESSSQHFSNPHMVIGLVVTVLAVLQPINAIIRPHVPTDKEPKLKRLIWQIIHKIFGYSAWILGCIACYLGLRLPMINELLLSVIHLLIWCLLLLIIYIMLSVIGYFRDQQTKEIEFVEVTGEKENDNDDHDDDDDEGDDDDNEDIEVNINDNDDKLQLKTKKNKDKSDDESTPSSW